MLVVECAGDSLISAAGLGRRSRWIDVNTFFECFSDSHLAAPGR